MLKNNKPAEHTLNQFSNDLIKKTQTLQERFPQVLATLDSQDETIQARFKSLTDAFEQLNIESSRLKQDLITTQFSKQKSEQIDKIDLKNMQWESKIQKLSTQLEKYCTHLLEHSENLTIMEIEQHTLAPISYLIAEFDQCMSLLKTTDQTLRSEIEALSDDKHSSPPAIHLIS